MEQFFIVLLCAIGSSALTFGWFYLQEVFEDETSDSFSLFVISINVSVGAVALSFTMFWLVSLSSYMIPFLPIMALSLMAWLLTWVEGVIPVFSWVSNASAIILGFVFLLMLIHLKFEGFFETYHLSLPTVLGSFIGYIFSLLLGFAIAFRVSCSYLKLGDLLPCM